jgi:hypothetical protein
MEPAPLWLIRGKYAGKICRLRRIVPALAGAAFTTPIQKILQRQCLEGAGGVGTPFAS